VKSPEARSDLQTIVISPSGTPFKRTQARGSLFIYRSREKILDVKDLRKMALKLLNSMSLLAASFTLASCGLNGGTVNQGTPPGTLVATGSMTGSATASVSVYDNSGSYYVQLASLNYSGTCGTPSIGVVAGGYVSGSTLTSTSSGSTVNYLFSSLTTAPTEAFIYCFGSNPIQSGIIAQTTTLNPT
jgi:hypothetical protein